MTTLYLCEKPSQARALAKAIGAHRAESGAFEGDGVIVTHCYGSMLSLATPDHYLNDSAWLVEALPVVPDKWDLVVIPAVRDQFAKIGHLLGRADQAVIATDPDDAGEVIGRHVLMAHGFNKPVKRLWASALDSNSLLTAVKNLLDLSETESYYRAGLVRMKMDWLFGMNLTRLFSIARGTTSKIGRVKTRLLGELIKREQEISGYVPSSTYQVSLQSNGVQFDSTLRGFATMPNLGYTAKCLSVMEDTVELAPPAPFTLSGLLSQVAAVDGISLAAAYAATQSLYECGLISYPRTSSTQLPDTNSAGFANHHAIIPVTTNANISSLGEVELAVYRAISKNYDMNLMGPSVLSRSIVLLEVDGMTFNHVSLAIKHESDPGWLLMTSDEYARYRRPGLPAGVFVAGRSYPIRTDVKVCTSSPPPRYTEASLLDMIVRQNIGTEATRVSEIGSLISDGVASLVDGAFLPTGLGRNLINDLPSAVKGPDMSVMVQMAMASARLSGLDKPHLAAAERWLQDMVSLVRSQCQKSSSRSLSECV